MGSRGLKKRNNIWGFENTNTSYQRAISSSRSSIADRGRLTQKRQINANLESITQEVRNFPRNSLNMSNWRLSRTFRQSKAFKGRILLFIT